MNIILANYISNISVPFMHKRVIYNKIYIYIEAQIYALCFQNYRLNIFFNIILD